MAVGTRAVVLGGSVAGLCAAGALADHFDEVVVLERDVLPADAQHRRGVPQSKHPHFVLNSGRQAMNALFPGFEDDLLAAGGMLLMPSYDAAYLEQPGWAPRKRSTMTMIYTSRILIERVLRDKVRGLANVRIEEAVTVQGLESDAGAVTGVRLQRSGDSATTLSADFVVDALGRGSSVADWLEQAGWPQPPVQTLDAKVTYVSRWYDLPSPEERPEAWWWHHIVVMPTQDRDPGRPDEHAYLSNFFPIDGNRAIACLGSWGLDMPKTSDDLAMAAKRLRTPLFSEAMERSTPTSEVHVTRSTGNKWRRYDRARKAPDRLVFIGDSICGFNPFYAQGMSAASMSAVVLKTALEGVDRLEPGFARRFTQEQAKLLKVPWGMAMARDQGFDCATGTEVVPRWRRRMLTSLGDKAFNAITGAAREDNVIDEHFAKVFNLDESLADMFRSPRVWLGLVRYQFRNALGRTTVPYGFDPMQDPPSTDYTPVSAS
jgi:2-polyprenyl-6-methoxyphenol hydroxylase-like FAD-dependent oxidoreductase